MGIWIGGLADSDPTQDTFLLPCLREIYPWPLGRLDQNFLSWFTAIIIRIWGVQQSTEQLVIEWKVHLPSLKFLGDQVRSVAVFLVTRRTLGSLFTPLQIRVCTVIHN